MRILSRPSGGFLTTLAVLGAILHGILSLTATLGKSTTADEIGYLTAGLAYNTRSDFRLHPENGNLSQRWIALPMTIAGVDLPSTELPTWRKADVWRYGHIFFYEGNLSTEECLFLSRAMVALVSAATGMLVFFWSRSIHGWRGGFLSLALFVFCPSFLTHGALATSDVTMTFFFVTCTWAAWRHLERPGPWGATVSAVALGCALVAKFSALLLVPTLGIVGLVWAVVQSRTEGWSGPLLRVARSGLVHGLVACATIWMFYGFRFSAFAPQFSEGADFIHSWDWMQQGLGIPGEFISWARELKLLPEGWLYGLAFVLGYSEQRAAFLSGEYSLVGWTGFFPFAFLVKTTLPFLAILLVASLTSARKWTQLPRSFAHLLRQPVVPLIALFVVYWAASVTSHLNIGHRHLLPIYPVLFIFAGQLGSWLDFRRPLAVLLVAFLTIWHGVESWRIRPHYLAYFNQLVGGPANGWRHLVDSSLDWGQDLPGLAQWLAQNNAPAMRAPVFLSYFGTGEPVYEGIVAHRLPSLPNFGQQHPRFRLTAGIYCVGATMLQQVYSAQHTWTLALEKQFQDLLSFESTFLAYQNDPVQRTELLKDFPAERWEQLWKLYDRLRFERLCYYLKVRGPDANIGYSILIFRLSAREIHAATGGTLAEWSQLIEKRSL